MREWVNEVNDEEGWGNELTEEDSIVKLFNIFKRTVFDIQFTKEILDKPENWEHIIP